MMTANQIDKALRIARSDSDLSLNDLDLFDGFGLASFKKITCTIEALAMLVRWQCICFDGSIDASALDEIADIGRRKFTVLEGGCTQC